MKAIIFDMDGVIVHNDIYHIRAWQEFCRELDFQPSEREVKSWFGSTNKTILESIFDRKMEPEETTELENKKEEIYRTLYRRDIKALPGLSVFLESISGEYFKIALATSAPRENVDFVLGMTGLRSFFTVITDASEIGKGKPDPEIFLKTAEKLRVEPENCLVFEDSFQGIESARRAGMKVVGVATSHPASELKNVDKTINDFREINISDLLKLWNKP